MKKLILVLIAVGICLPALWPMTRPQFFHLHDWTHVSRLVEMDQALKDGDFPVRWSKNLGFGYGLPQFNFYAPLFYYVAEVFYVLGFGAIWSIKLTVSLNYIVSFLAMYYWGAKTFNRYVGLTAATAFIYIPYRAVDTYVRGAFAELTAITFIALTLALISWWREKPNYRRAAWAAMAWAGIYLAHNLTAIVSFPFLILTLAGLSLIKPMKSKLWFQAGVMVGLAFGLAAFYLLPMALENKYTMADALTTGFSDFHHHFLYLRQLVVSAWGYGGSIYGVNDDISFRIGNLQLALTGVTLLLLVFWYKKFSKRQRSLMITSFMAIAAAILLSTFKTQSIWEWLTPMKYIQFPWRFLTVVITYISFLAGIAIFSLKDKSEKWQGGVALVIIVSLIYLNLSYFKPEKYLTNNEQLYFTDKKEIALKMSPVIPDFISRNTAKTPPAPPQLLLEAEPQVLELTMEAERNSEFLASMKIPTATTLTINSLYFPGWKLYVNGQETKPIIDPVWPVMKLNLPATSGLVIVSGRLTETPVRVVANIISLLSLFTVAYLIIKEGDGKNKYA